MFGNLRKSDIEEIYGELSAYDTSFYLEEHVLEHYLEDRLNYKKLVELVKQKNNARYAYSEEIAEAFMDFYKYKNAMVYNKFFDEHSVNDETIAEFSKLLDRGLFGGKNQLEEQRESNERLDIWMHAMEVYNYRQRQKKRDDAKQQGDTA